MIHWDTWTILRGTECTFHWHGLNSLPVIAQSNAFIDIVKSDNQHSLPTESYGGVLPNYTGFCLQYRLIKHSRPKSAPCHSVEGSTARSPDFNEALNPKLLGLKWSVEKYKGVLIPALGGLHISITHLDVIGRHMGNSDLSELWVEWDILGVNAIQETSLAVGVWYDIGHLKSSSGTLSGILAIAIFANFKPVWMEMRRHVHLYLWCHVHHGQECILILIFELGNESINIAGFIIHNCWNHNVSEFERNQWSASFFVCWSGRTMISFMHLRWSFSFFLNMILWIWHKDIFSISVLFDISQHLAQTSVRWRISACSDAHSISWQSHTITISELLRSTFIMWLELEPI